jgi:hypothetical protein
MHEQCNPCCRKLRMSRTVCRTSDMPLKLRACGRAAEDTSYEVASGDAEIVSPRLSLASRASVVGAAFI